LGGKRGTWKGTEKERTAHMRKVGIPGKLRKAGGGGTGFQNQAGRTERSGEKCIP